eukprot:gb/GECH01012807.1/.p1 GENE.gb/GECH01012807.1/~~gb/GECH01012807.1/.p1  ORF type:complete len:355 (+),score=81.78 gb/GECH01012807.1/:1-1065(+)
MSMLRKFMRHRKEAKSPTKGEDTKEKPHIEEEEEDVENWSLSDFEYVRILGTGTFGTVRLAKHKKTGKYYAIKVLRKFDILRTKQVQHIKNEKNILIQTKHPFLVNLFKTFQDENNLYMIMDYILGGEIFTHLRKCGKFPNDVAKFYIAQIVLALEHLHSRNVIYRDLKPENLLLDKGGNIKITDFGFAKVVNDRTYTLCGTPEYLAPEIIQSRGHGKAVDWWALGILMYEMLVGYPPFFDESPFKIYEKILENRVTYPRFIEPRAKDLIQSLLTTDTTKRLGALAGGAQDVKNHPWFSGVDWQALLDRKIPTPIPVKAKSAGDARYFENYPEDRRSKRHPKLTAQQQEYFADF